MAIVSVFVLPSGFWLKRRKLETFVKKGDELGFFSFGGSCILTFFENDKILLNQDLIETSKNEIELYAKMGEEMGVSKNFV